MSRLHVSYDADDPCEWTLEEPFTVETSIGTIEVPAGFSWNGVSVPQVLRSFVPARAYYGAGAVVHDWSYDRRRVSRKIADRVFRELLAPQIGPVGAWLIYFSVRLLGGRHWRSK